MSPAKSPLRRRQCEICTQINHDLHKQVTQVSPEALELLRSYHWPGNVRELENALTRAVVLATSSVLEASLLPIAPGAHAPRELAAPAGQLGLLPLREVEKQHIRAALAHTGWNKRRACALLEISRPTLDRKIEEYALSREADDE